MDAGLLNEAMKRVDEDVNLVDTLLNDVVKDFTASLDEIMQAITVEVVQVDSPAIVTIEKYFLELSNCLYFVSERCEKLGLFDSISKAKAQETYNNKYLEESNVDGKKPTVAELQAKAEGAAIYDRTVNDIYNKAYKIIKNKISAAENMNSTLSKLYSGRLQESQLTTQQSSRILNEAM